MKLSKKKKEVIQWFLIQKNKNNKNKITCYTNLIWQHMTLYEWRILMDVTCLALKGPIINRNKIKWVNCLNGWHLKVDNELDSDRNRQNG